MLDIFVPKSQNIRGFTTYLQKVYQLFRNMLSCVPVVVVLGSTGTGKSKLAIEIATKYGGEIISADSMQIYKSLDVITNKVTPEEQRMVKHHLIDVADPLVYYTVQDFRDQSVNIVERLLQQNKIPVVVGGTNYYIESLLWKVLVSKPPEIVNPENAERLRTENLRRIPSEELHRQLKDIDPEMADRLHPNNKRKIMRSLEVYGQFGRTHSSILKEQQSLEGGSSLGGPLRYKNCVIFWIQCDQDVLDVRLDNRVEEMLERGLITELADFHVRYNEERLATNTEPDYTTGIFQSIGFKEFHEYLILPEEQRQSSLGKELFKECVANLKLATRRYSRRQKKWIVNRFLRRPERQVPPVYGLNATDPVCWDDCVYKPAITILDSFVNNLDCSYKPLPVEAAHFVNTESMHYCETCERIFVGSLQWTAHLKSKKHEKKLKQELRKKETEVKT